MILGIDASNIRGGGTINHLVELLRAADPAAYGFSQVIVWSVPATLNRIEDRPWLVKSYQPLLDGGLPQRTFWQRFRLSGLARLTGCDLLFVPGGSYAGDFHPIATMCQNLLPFEGRELWRYGCSLTTVKNLLLRWTQSRTFCRAEGTIFSSQYAREEVMRVVRTVAGRTRIVSHGIHGRFVVRPREPLPISQFSVSNPFRILYVSTIEVYKHQWHVVEALARLRKSGLPVVLDLVGPAYPPALARLKETLHRIDPAGDFCRYSGMVPHAEVHARYAETDLFVFASSCESFGHILTEAMAAGLPIACSKRSTMPEVLGDAGVYFDPENPDSIAEAVRTLISSPQLRARLAKSAFDRARGFSWRRCAGETFEFLAEIAGTRHAGPVAAGLD